jgi:pimeloyl-ACP methyl ester carboxylesterase
MRRFFLLLALACGTALAADIDASVEHGYADSGGVKIHYASLGKGPLIVMIHGFPDFWYTWRNQMAELSSQFQTVAIDQRGYNLSDKPKGVDNYDMRLLVGDVVAVSSISGGIRLSSSATTGAARWPGNSRSMCPR